MNATGKRHPILASETVRTGGERRVALRVYCDERGQSVPLDVCRACPVCVRIETGDSVAERVVWCAPSHDVTEAMGVSAGAAACRGVIVIEQDLPIHDVVKLFVERRVSLIVVADSSGRAQAVVHDSRLMREIQDMSHVAPARLRLGWTVTALEPAMSVASTPVTVVETCALRDAVDRMANAHQRQVLVVDANGLPVGMLRDVDALHALRARDDEPSA
jgi:predicted transcriptional regulator